MRAGCSRFEREYLDFLDFLSDQIICLNFIIKYLELSHFTVLAVTFQGQKGHFKQLRPSQQTHVLKIIFFRQKDGFKATQNPYVAAYFININ